MIYTAIQKQEKMPIYSKKQAQVGALLFDEALTEISAEYSNYSNVFSAKNIAKLLENIRIKKHAIKLEEDKQSPFSPIYSLESIELEILKTYIKTNLANNFIRPSKSPVGVPIFFNRKPNRSLCLYIDY